MKHFISEIHALNLAYVTNLYKLRRQDGLFFIGKENPTELLEQLQTLVPHMFRTDIPIFMPLEHSETVQLRLDSNFLFYQEQDDGTYRLSDKFATNFNESHQVRNLGTWRQLSNGNSALQLKKTKNRVNVSDMATLHRWNRRRNLTGVPFSITEGVAGPQRTYYNSSQRTFYNSSQRSVVQDSLSYMTRRLNLSVTKRNLGGSDCTTLLLNHTVDTCSQRHTSVDVNVDQLGIVPIHGNTYTLLAKRPPLENDLGDYHVFQVEYKQISYLPIISADIAPDRVICIIRYYIC